MHKTILLDHGSGGRASRDLVHTVLASRLSNPLLDRMDDAACLQFGAQRIAFTTDSYVVDPIFFPGGDIGLLAINGTVNDLAMLGATPQYLSVGLILEEGFATADLERIVDSMAAAAKRAHVQVVTGDTKVVARGAADKIFINTAGVGSIAEGVNVSGSRACVGDCVIVSGLLGEHGIAVLSQRSGLSLQVPCVTDSQPLGDMVAEMLQECSDLHCLRDPTRGGLAATLNEISEQSSVKMEILEQALPISPAVNGACEILGLDPLGLANEGVLVAVVPGGRAETVVARMRKNSAGSQARIVGEVVVGKPSVVMRTSIGGRRIVAMPSGAQLPRIC